MEVYNSDKQPMFRRYVRSLLDAKMLEVCSTTLPQMVMPRVYSDPRYEAWSHQRRAFFASRAKQATELLSATPALIVNQPHGAFYLSAVFADELDERMNLKIEDRRVEEFLNQRCSQGMQPDRKFVYELIGAQQICIVPLAGFMCDLRGFRVTLLERDDATFTRVMKTIAAAVDEFVNSV
jgi:aspartate/methionine/tyrosine aminotransferase